MEPHMNGGNPERICPETGFEALCFQKACETATCEGSHRQNLEFELAIGETKDESRVKSQIKFKRKQKEAAARRLATANNQGIINV